MTIDIVEFQQTPWGLWAVAADGKVYSVASVDGHFELRPVEFRVAAPKTDD